VHFRQVRPLRYRSSTRCPQPWKFASPAAWSEQTAIFHATSRGVTSSLNSAMGLVVGDTCVPPGADCIVNVVDDVNFIAVPYPVPTRSTHALSNALRALSTRLRALIQTAPLPSSLLLASLRLRHVCSSTRPLASATAAMWQTARNRSRTAGAQGISRGLAAVASLKCNRNCIPSPRSTCRAKF
jgi:hypothetical protein